MNASVIVGLLVFMIPGLAVVAGLVSDNVFVNLDVDANRHTAPITFWAVTGMWSLMAAIGLVLVLVNWGR